MRGPQKLLDSEDNWRTRMGAWFPGERVVYRGKDLFEEFQDQSWMGLFLYGITGRRFRDNQIKLFEGIWKFSASFPDPRLWNNRIASLAGTGRSTATLGISAATAISEATIYGQSACMGAIDFLYRTRKKLDLGGTLEDLIRIEIKKYRGIPGYGRPIVRTDERIIPLLDLAKNLGLSNGPYVKLAFAVEEFLIGARWRRKMNVAGLGAALVADQGLTSYEHYCFMIPCFTAGIMPCSIESSTKAEGTFFPLRCNRIDYQGRPRRAWLSDDKA